jgi:cytochrome c peroxidase
MHERLERTPSSSRWRSAREWAPIVVLLLLAVSPSPGSAAGIAQPLEPISPLPAPTHLDPARAAIGARMFGDVRLSRNSSQSCATCHPLDRGGADGRQHTIADTPLQRDTPTIFNLRHNLAFNWDGSAASIATVTNNVVKGRRRFDTTWQAIVAVLAADKAYVDAFKAAYPEGLTAQSAEDALVVYQQTLVTTNGRFDRYLRGERTAISGQELEGYELFKSLGCVSCHQGVNVGGNLFQKFGVFSAVPRPATDAPDDPGRFRGTKGERDRGVFRVPSLRNVALTPPYFHDGRAPTLEAAVRTMAKVQLSRTLSPNEVDSIVSFLRTLTGELNGRPLDGSATARTAGATSK